MKHDSNRFEDYLREHIWTAPTDELLMLAGERESLMLVGEFTVNDDDNEED